MPDVRPSHTTIANSLYGPRGPQQALGHYTERPLTTKLRWPAGQPVEPQTIAEHLTSAIAKVPTLSARQRAAVVAVLVEKCRDIGFLRMLSAELGPKAPASEGRIL
jgi:hypothetical protein